MSQIHQTCFCLTRIMASWQFQCCRQTYHTLVQGKPHSSAHLTEKMYLDCGLLCIITKYHYRNLTISVQLHCHMVTSRHPKTKADQNFSYYSKSPIVVKVKFQVSQIRQKCNNCNINYLVSGIALSGKFCCNISDIFQLT